MQLVVTQKNLKAELAEYPGALECTDTSDKGAKPGFTCGSSESTPLHAAAYYGHDLVCMLLISRGAKVAAKNRFGNTPVDEAKTDELKQKLLELKKGDIIASLTQSVQNVNAENITHRGKTVARILRLQNIDIPKNWLPAWHGTKYNYLNSILKNGLQPSGAVVDGTAIRPPKGHYQLGSTHFGVNNWASAVFISPSLIYAGHPTYSERVVLGGTQWCIIICVLCRPGSFGSYPSTIVRDDPIDGEPEDSEWRVDMEGDDLIWRMAQGSTSSSLVVTGVVFIDLKFFDSIGSDRSLTYREASKLVHTNYSRK
ncbi:uncharacterized protein LOC134853408 isoform X2 [Symsagittifera roscoffensis]|uniref:uncharacterized protein LOC134853408 isoform X2 n=1 Tax=Symsagittifera roscoffensis TaxID=84072 RepID=UPI00307C9A35